MNSFSGDDALPSQPTRNRKQNKLLKHSDLLIDNKTIENMNKKQNKKRQLSQTEQSKKIKQIQIWRNREDKQEKEMDLRPPPLTAASLAWTWPKYNINVMTTKQVALVFVSRQKKCNDMYKQRCSNVSSENSKTRKTCQQQD